MPDMKGKKRVPSLRTGFDAFAISGYPLALLKHFADVKRQVIEINCIIGQNYLPL